MNRLLQAVMLVCIVSSPMRAHAQTGEPIIAERPGFSSSPIAMAPSALQIEAGYQFTREGGGIDFEDHTLPLLLIRAGLAENLELQVSWAGYSRLEAGGQSVDGSNDAAIGLKWQLSDSTSTVPVALFAGLSLPVGEDPFTSDETEPAIGALWSYGGSLDWFGTVILSESNGDATWSNAVGINFPIDPATGAYVEYFGNFPVGAGPEHYLNGGLTYLPRLDLQLDLHIGAGLNDRAADLFVGTGIAYRF